MIHTVWSSSTPWTTRAVRGSNPDPLIDYVLLAEFDIDTGSTVRHQYPVNVPDYKADWFAEHMLPEGAHNRDIDYTYIFLNRDAEHIDADFWIKPKTLVNENQTSNTTTSSSSGEGNSASDAGKHFLYGLNVVKTRHDSTVRRGAIVKAMCIFSRYHFIEIFKRPLEIALEDYFDHPSVDVLKKFYEAVNKIDISTLPRPDYLERLIMRRGVSYHPLRTSPMDHTPSHWSRTLTYNYGGDSSSPLHLTVPVHNTPDEVGDISVTNLVKLFGESVMRIYHAILTKQRVIFVGYSHAAGDIAQIVLSSVAMVAPPMTDLIRRTFPYANLSDLGFLEVKGFIAGVTNPMFQQRETWWDLLCVLDLPNNTAHVYSAEEKAAEDNKTRSANSNNSNNNNNSKLNMSSVEEMPHYQADMKFIQTVISGINSRLGEEWVRQQFLDYTTNILNNTIDKGMFLNTAKLGEKAKKFIEMNLSRMSTLELSQEFQQMPSHLWVWGKDDAKDANANTSQSSEGGPAADEELDGIVLKTYVRKLKYEANLDSKQETEEFFRFFEKNIRTEPAMQALLAMVPESQGGILSIAAGLFSPSPSIRYNTVLLLQRIASYPSTKSAMATLNSFMISAYERQLKKFNDGTLLKEVEEFKKHDENTKSEPTTDSGLQVVNNPVFENQRSTSIEAAASSIAETISHTSESISSLLQQTLTFVTGEEQGAEVNPDSEDHRQNTIDLIP